MKTSHKYVAAAMLLAVSVGLCLLYWPQKTKVAILFDNSLSTDVLISEVYVDGKRIVFASPMVLAPGTRSFSSGKFLSLGEYANPVMLTIYSDPGKKKVRSCKIARAEPGESCNLVIDVASVGGQVCHCDSTSDFK